MASTNQTPQRFEGKIDRTVRVEYLLFLPQQYRASGGPSWPLLLFLHGSGERGSNLSKVTAHGPPRLVKRQPDFPFVVVSPQCPAGKLWSNDILLALLDEVTRQHHVDPGRVYLTGLSMGGYATWNLALECPERFAAIVPICGGGEALPVLLAGPKKVRALRTLGIWAFHGGADPTVPVSESEKMVETLRHIGCSPKLTVYPGIGHDSWTETYDNPEVYLWLLRHRRKGAR